MSTKNLTYALWENKSWLNSLWESSASCAGLHHILYQLDQGTVKDLSNSDSYCTIWQRTFCNPKMVPNANEHPWLQFGWNFLNFVLHSYIPLQQRDSWETITNQLWRRHQTGEFDMPVVYLLLYWSTLKDITVMLEFKSCFIDQKSEKNPLP